MTKITDIPHFEQCRILDYVKWNCDHRNGNESIAAIKYLDILNFAMASHIFDRIVWNWSRPMYELLEIEKRLFPDKKITVKFNRIHDALKKASSAQKESYIDINISTMMNKMSLDCIELEYEPQEFVVDHDDIFQDVLKAIQGEKSRKEFIILDPIVIQNLQELIKETADICKQGDAMICPPISSKIKEVIIDIAEVELQKKANRNNLLILDPKTIPKLNDIFVDTTENEIWCNVNGKEFFIFDSNETIKVQIIVDIRDREDSDRVKYVTLDQGRTKKVKEIVVEISELNIQGDAMRKEFINMDSTISVKLKQIIKNIANGKETIILREKDIPKIKELIVNISDRKINDLGNFRNISKLRLTASFDMADLEEFCINNPGLVDLEINSYHFTDHGRLTQIVPNCPKLKNLKFILNDNAWDMDYVRLANLSSLQRLEIEKPPSSVVEYDWQSSPEFAAKRARMDYEVRNLIPVLELLKALSQKKKSTLVKLILKFDIDDETVCEIVKIKGLRMLECGLCYLSSIGHLKQISSLQQVTLLNRGHLVSDDVVELLKKRVTISGVDTRMTLTAGGHLGIDSTDAELYRSVNVDIFLKIENLKSLWLSNDLIISMDLALVKFLELGIEVKCNACTIQLDTKTRSLHILYDSDYWAQEFPLPLVKNLTEFTFCATRQPSQELLHELAKEHSRTLEEIYIGSAIDSGTSFEALTSLKSLRRFSCGFIDFKYIEPLAQLSDLNHIAVLTPHDTKDTNFAECLGPILKNCQKLNSLEIKFLCRNVTEEFLASINNAIKINRNPFNKVPLNVCLSLETTNYLSTEQMELITRYYKHMNLSVTNEDCCYIFINSWEGGGIF